MLWGHNTSIDSLTHIISSKCSWRGKSRCGYAVDWNSDKRAVRGISRHMLDKKRFRNICVMYIMLCTAQLCHKVYTADGVCIQNMAANVSLVPYISSRLLLLTVSTIQDKGVYQPFQFSADKLLQPWKKAIISTKKNPSIWIPGGNLMRELIQKAGLKASEKIPWEICPKWIEVMCFI